MPVPLGHHSINAVFANGQEFRQSESRDTNDPLSCSSNRNRDKRIDGETPAHTSDRQNIER